MSTNSNTQDLIDLLMTRGLDVEMFDFKTNRPPVNDEGKSNPIDADDFVFDWVSSRGKNYGTVEIFIGDGKTMQVASADNTGRAMEPEDKDEWFEFIQSLSRFAKSHRLYFDFTNLSKIKLNKTSMAALSEGFIGNRHYSFTGSPTEARLMIKHSKIMGEGDQRFRYIESIFIETADGERFKLKTRSLVEGRAQLQHVKQGGRPWDERGCHISEMVEQAKILSQFRRAHNGKIFESEAQQLIVETEQYYQSLRHDIKSLSSSTGYKNYFENWSPTAVTEKDIMIEDLKDLFVETKIDPRIEQALPLMAQIKETKMKELDIFEAWADRIANKSMTREEELALEQLMLQPLVIGPDAVNVVNQLPGMLADDEELLDILRDLAEADPNTNIWENPQVIHRFEELGIEIPTTSAEQPNAAAGEPAPEPIEPGTAPVEPAPEPIEPEMSEDNTPGAVGFLKETGDDHEDLDRIVSLAVGR